MQLASTFLMYTFNLMFHLTFLVIWVRYVPKEVIFLPVISIILQLLKTNVD